MFKRQFAYTCMTEALQCIQKMIPDVQQLFPQVKELLILLAVNPVSGDTVERCFSCPRRLKTCLYNESTETQFLLDAKYQIKHRIIKCDFKMLTLNLLNSIWSSRPIHLGNLLSIVNNHLTNITNFICNGIHHSPVILR